MHSKSMNTQELKLADNYLGLLEFLPMSVQWNIIERFFEKHNKELKENLYLDSGEESSEELKKIATEMSIDEFINLTNGCFNDTPLQKPSQLDYEKRLTLENYEIPT